MEIAAMVEAAVSIFRKKDLASARQLAEHVRRQKGLPASLVIPQWVIEKFADELGAFRAERAEWVAEHKRQCEQELVDDEAERLQAAMRDDYAPFFAFAQASGLRLRECLLRWPEVDWKARQIRKPGKGDKLVTVPITSTIREILWPLREHHSEFVFTYVAQRTRDGRTRGERHPLTYHGVKIAWRRLRKRSGVADFRFHDYRHNLGTKLLRETGNLKLVQRALNHADLKTTSRYAHVLDSEVAEAMESVARDQKSLKKSPTKVRDVI